MLIELALLCLFILFVTSYIIRKEYFSDPHDIDMTSDTPGQKYTSSDVFTIVNLFLVLLGDHHSCIRASKIRRQGTLLKIHCFIQDNTHNTLNEYEVVGKIPMSRDGEYSVVSHSILHNQHNTIQGGAVQNGSYKSLNN